ncbi:hypothetical protein CYLTODRAFT_420398 [Cylindrobasidium torrendii FP15055 ss-10]|uniref:Velvet domain-containing protein n=1 Tax=Cylindrobasidium torrendii FP15055 ss-10 TaxID=1314674 RepID=A0A0D7BJC1_9AGAR|nr:hypothetical protein CYLTODRAFT_420398 [Cylindrobasidium torrendii FP15055 ss-10]
MIQQTSNRNRASSQVVTDGPDIWDQMNGPMGRTYALEPIQNPLRARMCGFGDKDRRPLAPAAVAKMIVTNPDGSIVDPHEIDCSFFVCTVDLWDHHGTTEMNLVLHPSSSDKVPVPTPAPATPAPPPPSGPSWQQSAGPSSANDATPYRPWSAEPGGSTSPTFIPAPEQDKTDRQIQSLPRHTYTRTLVGPLSANAQLLKDEHRKPGIFFLFQDLSVRTEGSFRLRMRLVNIGAHPAPDPGAVGVHTDVSPVLAQTFTEPFTVWSAKRFPGVPDTTALSIAFGNQGQKLPLRNRHGSGKRARPGNSDSESDS